LECVKRDFSFFVKKNEKMEKVCEGEDLGVANGRISPSRSPFLATAEKRMAGMGKKIKYGESVSCSKDWTLK
jgi:hypothetical protein